MAHMQLIGTYDRQGDLILIQRLNPLPQDPRLLSRGRKATTWKKADLITELTGLGATTINGVNINDPRFLRADLVARLEAELINLGQMQ